MRTVRQVGRLEESGTSGESRTSTNVIACGKLQVVLCAGSTGSRALGRRPQRPQSAGVSWNHRSTVRELNLRYETEEWPVSPFPPFPLFVRNPAAGLITLANHCVWLSPYSAHLCDMSLVAWCTSQ